MKASKVTVAGKDTHNPEFDAYPNHLGRERGIANAPSNNPELSGASMPPSLQHLQAFKLAQLKHIALQCGINTTGTKAVLTSRLQHDITVSSIPRGGGTGQGVAGHPPQLRSSTPNLQTTKTRVLSIDMGIRNLAYCVLDLPQYTAASASTAPPSLIAWQRFSIAPRPTSSSPKPGEKESFLPHLYASHAYNLVTRALLPHIPTHILIERQRHRSMGGAAIQEWTVRVNMFEGMIHAVLRTLREEGRWRGVVEGVSPARVGGFWLGGREDAVDCSPEMKGTKSKVNSKKLKIDLVGGWLKGEVRDQPVRVGTPQAVDAANAYLERWNGEGRKMKRKEKASKGDLDQGCEKTDSAIKLESQEKIGKLDDLADCLLQGIAWTRWQKNRRQFLESGDEQELIF